MSPSKLVHTTIKGLKLEIARYIRILNNNTLNLKNNFRKYESIEFMINGKSTQFPEKIRLQKPREHNNIINNN